jgi:hypothetical protein
MPTGAVLGHAHPDQPGRQDDGAARLVCACAAAGHHRVGPDSLKVLRRFTIRGSIGGWQDLREAFEAAADGSCPLRRQVGVQRYQGRRTHGRMAMTESNIARAVDRNQCPQCDLAPAFNWRCHNDDVSHTGLCVEHAFDIESPDTVCALFYGLGADGTVGANRNSTQILAS